MKINMLAAVLLLVPGLASGAESTDPDWPCIQRKVENLSPGLMWAAPVTPTELSPDARALASKLALRRVGLDEAQALITAYVADHPGTSENDLGNIFTAVFDRIGKDRRRVMGGIASYAHSQVALAARINTARVEMDTLSDAATPDFDRIDQIEEQIAWDERIYNDREHSLTYVCETPVLLEKRLYAIARMLQAALPE
jgi:hypothetical protein